MTDPIRTEKWLRQWLQPIDPIQMIQILGRDYLIVFHFRIAFYVHCVFYDILTKEYIWYVIENGLLYEEEFYRSKRYLSYDEMIHAVSCDFKCHPISPKHP